MSENANIPKTLKNLMKIKVFKDFRGLDPTKTTPETIKNQSLEGKRPKVRPKSGPSAEKI